MKGSTRILVWLLTLLATAEIALGAITRDTPPPERLDVEPIPELKPPQGLLPEEPSRTEWWGLAVAAACFIAAVALLWPRRVRRETEIPPAQRARLELQRMRHPDPVVLGQIVRTYAVETLAAPGPGQTFQELAALLAAHPRVTAALSQRFKQLADPIEIAKFAPHATPQDLVGLRDDAIALIEEFEAIRRPTVEPTPP